MVLMFWSNIFFSLKIYVVYNYIAWLIQEKVLNYTLTLLLPLLFPVFAVQVAIQVIKNFVFSSVAGLEVTIGPY